MSPGELSLATAAEEPGRMIWEHDRHCQCGSRTYMFGQCFKCLKEEIAERNREMIDRITDQDVAEPAGEGEEVLPAGSVRAVGDPLPVLPVATGENTRAVLFVTDRMLEKLLRNGSSPRWKLDVKVMKWEPGKDLRLPKDGQGGP